MRVVNRYKDSHVKSSMSGVIYVATRADAIAGFEDDARSDKQLRGEILLLPQDAVLGCTCKPKDCHGDVVVRLWHEWHGIPYIEPRKRNTLL